MKLSDWEADRIIREGWQAYTDSFPREGIPEHPFSPAFERKMARLVRRQRRRENRPPVLRAAGRAAAILLVCAAVAFSGLMTVEAFREQVIRFFSQVFPTHTELSFTAEGYGEDEHYVLELGYLPEGMTETEHRRTGPVSETVYEGGGRTLRVMCREIRGNLVMSVDTEDARTDVAELNGRKVWVIQKNGRTRLYWLDKNLLISLSGELPAEEMKKIAEQSGVRPAPPGAWENTPPPAEEEEGEVPSAAEPNPEFDRFQAYFDRVAPFLHQPAASPQELPRDRALAGFLLDQSYRRGVGEGRVYERDADGMALIPDGEIAETAEMLLGIADFRPDSIAEWPFPGGKEGYRSFDPKAPLPVCEITYQLTQLEEDAVYVKAIVSTEMDENGYPLPGAALIYRFGREAGENGEYRYPLESISPME